MRVIVALLLVLSSPSALADAPSLPKLFFEPSWLYDNTCRGNGWIDPRWEEELRQRKPEFERIWAEGASALFEVIFRDFGRGFTRKELTATLSVCSGGASYSSPLVLNTVRFLKSYMGDRPVQSDLAFLDLVFHELLHTWVVENVPWPTPLAQKYKDESGSVTSHLHLMAIQKHVYLALHRQDLLDWLDEKYPAMMDPSYGRAWKIVNEIEGYEAFIVELPRAPGPR